MRRSSLLLAVLLFGLLGMGATSNELGGPPPWTIPELPTSGTDKKCCIAQIEVVTREGTIDFTLKEHHVCKFLLPKPMETFQAPASIHMVKLISGNCDQTQMFFKKPPLELLAKGDIIYRADGLAHFTGKVELRSPAGVKFNGRMESTFRISTHTDPVGQESCHPENQAEGWLVGSTSTNNINTVRAQLTFKYSGKVMTDGTPTQLKVIAAVLNGVVTDCH